MDRGIFNSKSTDYISLVFTLIINMLKLLTVGLLTLLVLNTSSVPLKNMSNEEYDAAIKEKERRIDILEQIHESLESMMRENFMKLFHKLSSLTMVSDELLELTKGKAPSISYGTRGQMTNRCPENFRAVAGDRICY